MNYQEAAKLRKKSFGTLLAEQEGGLGSSIKSAISQKTKAKITGIKEKFDPLNIAKTLTGGSNWAPAMLGKLFNADKSRVDYFSGVKNKTASLSGNDSGTIDSPEAIECLGYIYKSLKQSAEDKKLANEQKRNRLEEEDSEEESRNQEIVKALTGKIYTKKTKPKPEWKKGVEGETHVQEQNRWIKHNKDLAKWEKQNGTTITTKTPTTTAKTFDVITQVRNAGASVASIATKVAGVTAITSLGVSKAAAISIKGETGSTNKKEILQKGAQIVPNDPKPGVFSYGIFGMNSAAGTVDQFIKQNPQFGFKEKPGTTSFNEEWKRISSSDTQAFFDAQIKWHDRNIIKPLEKDLQKMLPSNIPLDDRILTYMADRRIQYGKTLESDAFKYASSATNSADFITKITDFDLSTIGQAFKTYLSTHPDAQKGLQNRIENRRTLSMELTKNDIGNKIDTVSKENKNSKADIESKNSKPIIISTTNINSQTNTEAPVQSVGDRLNAYQQKARN